VEIPFKGDFRVTSESQHDATKEGGLVSNINPVASIDISGRHGLLFLENVIALAPLGRG